MSYRTHETDIVRLKDILKTIDAAADFSKNGLEDHQAMMATAYCIAIIGEASNHLTGELVLNYPEIPWRDIIGMRHKIIHGYSKVDVEILKEVVITYLPKLRVQIQEILEHISK